MSLNYSDTQLLEHLRDCTPAQLSEINEDVAIQQDHAMVGPIEIGEGTSEDIQDIIDDINNRTAADIETLGGISRSAGWGTIIDGLPG